MTYFSLVFKDFHDIFFIDDKNYFLASLLFLVTKRKVLLILSRNLTEIHKRFL